MLSSLNSTNKKNRAGKTPILDWVFAQMSCRPENRGSTVKILSQKNPPSGPARRRTIDILKQNISDSLTNRVLGSFHVLLSIHL